MQNISEINFINVGRFVKTHGYKGEITLKLNSEFIKLPETELLFVELDGIAVPFFIEENGLKLRGTSYSVKFDTVHSDTRAEELKNCPVLLPDYYFEDEQVFDEFAFLDNFSVFDNEVSLGTAVGVQKIPGNPLLEVKEESGSFILIPMNDHFIKNIDEGNKTITFNLPEGLIDINRG